MISQKYNLNSIISKLINIRKIKESSIDNFFNNNLNDTLPEPYVLIDMELAVNRVYESIISKKTIGIIADYDVDGSTSSSLMIKFLRHLNINTYLEVPDRINEGYGPNERIIKLFLDKNVDLIISLDCGTTSFKVFNELTNKKIDTIVIDHHVSDITLPKVFALINPNRFDENNNLKNLATVGITFLFLIALRRKLRNEKYYLDNKINENNLTELLDLVSLGTICDVVKLDNLNRSLVKKGLEIISKRNNKGISSLIDISNIRRKPNSYDLSFNVGPRLNAASRIGEAKLAPKLLFSTDLFEIDSITKKLDLLNTKRKLIENKVFNEAKEQAYKLNNHKILILHSYDWHLGILGIVASKLVDHFCKPVIVLSKSELNATGSARSIPGVNLGALILSAKSQGIILEGGGHYMAGGLKVKITNIDNLLEFFNKNITSTLNNYENINIIYDSVISIEELNNDFLNSIEFFEPFGNGNPEPQFIIKNLSIHYLKVIKEKHIILHLINNLGNIIKGLCFNCIDNNLGQNLLSSKNKNLHFACTIQRDSFSKESGIQIIVKDAVYSK